MNEFARKSKRIDAGLYQTTDGKAMIESQKRRLDGVHSDYGTAGWWLTIEGQEPWGPYETKAAALAAYIEETKP